MKLTKIRQKNNKLSNDMLHLIGNKLVETLNKKGYITQYYIINSSRIDLKLHGRSFKIDTNKLGYNARLNPHINWKKGYRRTSTPTWDQRVDYNNIINDVLNSFKISCNIKSGNYIIRKSMVSYNESEWLKQKEDWEHHNEMRGFKVIKISEAS